MQQFLTESLVLTLTGGVLGVMMAFGGLRRSCSPSSPAGFPASATSG